MATVRVLDNPYIQNIEAEIAIIASLLCNPKVADRIADILEEQDFSDTYIGEIYGLIVREFNLGRALNPVTLRPYLEGQEDFTNLGGWQWLAGITETNLSVIAAVDSAKQIVALAQRRRLINGLRETIALAADLEQPVETLLASAETAISDARGDKGGSYELTGAQCVNRVVNSFNQPLGGVECGVIPSLDNLLGPMRPTHFIVGAGRPGMGKTATAVSYALGAADRGHGVLFISLEMGADELGERMAADLCLSERIPHHSIRDRQLDMLQQREICRAMNRLEQMPLQVIDRSGLTIMQLRSLVRRWKRRFEARGHKLELVILDYLQLMRGDKKMDRFELVSEASRTCKEIAKEHGLAVWALSQLSRSVESRNDRRPMLSDLRESGQIEQDADAVLFLMRDEYYLRANEPPQSDPKHEDWQRKLDLCQGRIEFICAKRRGGATGAAIGDFLYHYQAVRG